MSIARQRSTLTREQLQAFDTPLSWREILALGFPLTKAELRDAIISNDEYGLGFLAWTPAWPRRSRKPQQPGTWKLTARGRRRAFGRSPGPQGETR